MLGLHSHGDAVLAELNAISGKIFIKQDNAVTIRVWGRNLGNSDYAVHGLYFANDPRKGYINEAYRQFGEPRVYGVDVRYEFH